MKKCLLMALLAILCLSVKAQKIFRTDIDKFTGDTTVETKFEVLYSKLGLSNTRRVNAAILKTKDYWYLKLEIIEYGTGLFMVKEGMKCHIKFSNNEILSLSCPETIIGKNYYSTYADSIDAFVYYHIEDEDVEKIKNNNIAIVRVETTNRIYDYEIEKKKSDIIKNQLNLVDK